MTPSDPERAALFDVELYWPGVTPSTAAELVELVRSVAGDVAGGGPAARFLGATLSPRDEVCFLRFESSRAAVERVVREMGLKDARITEVMVVKASRE